MLTKKEKRLQEEILRDPYSLESLRVIQDYELGDNLYFMLPILKKYPDLTPKFPKMLKNKQIAYHAVKQIPSIYIDLEPELKEDADIALRALMSSKGKRRDISKYISPKLLNNPNFIDRSIKMDKDILVGLPTAIYKLGGLFIRSVSRMTQEDTLHLKNSLMKTTMAINNSLVPGFSKVLKDVVITVGRKQDFFDLGLMINEAIAYYRMKQSDIIFFFDETGEKKNDFVFLIHELAHKFHHQYIKDGLNNQDIKKLYDVATNSRAECKRVSFPKIGDPLSNIYDYDSKYHAIHLVRTATPEVYFVGISENNKLVYKTKDGSGSTIYIPKEYILKMTRCPSAYSAETPCEFFAEMCVAITINKVTPAQEQWANHFINIVKKNLK
jgi:hypothetical protein